MTKIELFDDAILGKPSSTIAWSVTIMTRQRHDIASIELSHVQSMLEGSFASIACYFSVFRLFDVQEVDGAGRYLQLSCVRKSHIQVSMMARHYKTSLIPPKVEGELQITIE